jgi:hypothetical protein
VVGKIRRDKVHCTPPSCKLPNDRNIRRRILSNNQSKRLLHKLIHQTRSQNRNQGVNFADQNPEDRFGTEFVRIGHEFWGRGFGALAEGLDEVWERAFLEFGGEEVVDVREREGVLGCVFLEDWEEVEEGVFGGCEVDAAI